MSPAFDPWRIVLLVVAVCATLGLERGGLLRGVDNFLSERRMELAPRSAGGDIVFLGIDKRSLDRVGAWPWPRRVHAEIIDRLNGFGAAEIVFDVDVSAPSTPDADAALARALQTSPAAVVLPAMLQDAVAGGTGRALERSLPLPMFREHAWLASVNVRPDPDGMIRRYPYGQALDGEPVPSIPAMLAGALGRAEPDFAIDFSIRPSTVPTHSVDDLLDGRLAADAVRGRSVVVGAYAVELRDNFSVPAHGVLSGSLVQILAAETLAQDRALTDLKPVPLAVATAAMLACLAALGGFARLGVALGALAAVSLSVEAAAFLAQARLALVAPTSATHLVVVALAAGLTARELSLRGWLVQAATVERTSSQKVLRQIVDDSSDAVVVADDAGTILHMSRRAGEIFGSATTGPGDPRLDAVLPPELVEDVRRSIADAKAGRWSDPGLRHLMLLRDGQPRTVEYRTAPSVIPAPRRLSRARVGSACVACLTARDVTERLRQQAELDRLSRFDELTGAMRRAEFLRHLQDCPGNAEGSAVFPLKLRRFKTVNATLGRRVGDAVLQGVVRRLAASERVCVARLGSDVFAVHSAAADPAEATAVGQALAAAVAAPYVLDGATARIGVHVGMALLDPAEPELTLDRAEEALDEARKLDGDAVRAFDPATSARQEAARRIERALWPALDHDQFFLAYQPQVRLSDLGVVGAEALARWGHLTMGLVSPGDFIPIAETCGFIGDLGRWVLRRACADAACWAPDTTVAVNVSPVQFQRNDVVGDVREALAASGLPARRLQLEITESIFVDGSHEVLETLHDLRMMGVSLALDDFGSGFSSFGYLANLPLDKIKADQMFIRQLAVDSRNCGILKSIRLLSSELGLKLTCEGVETEEQLAFLRSIGCEEGQGYLFGRPQPQEQICQVAAPSESGRARSA